MMKKITLWMIAATLTLSGMTVLTSCSKDDQNIVTPQPQPKEYFTLWNQCEALTALQDYVKDVTNPSSANFIPAEERIATFDMDGTFVGELYPSYFEYNLLEYRALDDATYEAPKDVMETAQEIRDFVRNGKKLPDHFDMKHAYAAAKAYSGMTLAEFDTYVKTYARQSANGFTGMTYGESFYKPMLEVFDYLKDNGFTYYVVSGSDRFICRALTESIGIPSNRVIGMDVKLHSTSQGDVEGVNYTMGKEEELVRTDELIIKNLKTNKVLQISQEIGKVPVLSFGNSGGDAAMHNYALGNQKYKSAAFMLIADDDARDHANREKALTLGDQWRTAGYHVISMCDDFKTIYGDGVTKTDFTFPVDIRPLTEWQAGRTVSQEAVEAFGGIDNCFAAEPIPDGVWARMQGKTYKENPYIGRDDLRHIRALHWDYDNQMHVGEMVCNALIADRVVTILRQLFDAKYPIQRMLLPDVYDADDETQMRDNTSCFCYRVIAGSTKLSKHARGLAIDINTLYNPYYRDLDDGTRFIQPATAAQYCDRTWDFPYKIDHDDLCFRLFTEAGFEWGGDWTTRKDYQHFEIIE